MQETTNLAIVLLATIAVTFVATFVTLGNMLAQYIFG